MKFEVYQQAVGVQAGQWRWRLKAANGETLAQGESYRDSRDCLHAISLVRATGLATPVINAHTGERVPY